MRVSASEYRKMTKKKSKYRNQKVDGYDSKKERDRAAELRLFQKLGYISNLREQVKFVLIPAQYKKVEVQLKTKTKLKDVCVEKECSYKADFTYNDNREDGAFVVEDTKGMKTEVYKIKRKLMLQVHGIKIKET